MADISKEQLKKEIQDILKDADLDNTSAKKVECYNNSSFDPYNPLYSLNRSDCSFRKNWIVT